MKTVGKIFPDETEKKPKKEVKTPPKQKPPEKE